MPLTKLQSHVLRVLAAERSPDSYIAGGVAINREGPRFSGDIDIFQDTEQRLQDAAQADAKALAAAGLKFTFRVLATERPIDVPDLHRRIRSMLEEAGGFISRIPSDAVGAVFLERGKAVQPDLAALEKHQRHAGAPRGVWPSSPEISSAMLERYKK